MLRFNFLDIDLKNGLSLKTEIGLILKLKNLYSVKNAWDIEFRKSKNNNKK